MLPHFGAKLEVTNDRITVVGNQQLQANVVEVPGDPSTAAFWIGAACMIPGATLELHNISLNPTRLGMIDILLQMGADIKMHITKSHPEPMGTILVRYQELKGVSIPREIVPSLIDEIPMIAVLATQAVGVTEIHGAEELRVKESDRLEAIATNIRSMGGKIDIFHDGFTLTGKQSLVGGVIQTFHDHRMAMAFSIAALVARGETTIMGSECVAVSYPNFFETLSELTT